MDTNADSIKLSGLLTSLELFLPHFVDIDNESLPTGITMLLFLQTWDSLSTAWYKLKSSFFSDELAIQFADNLILLTSPIYTEDRFVIISPNAISTELVALIDAIFGFSPIVKACPEEEFISVLVMEKFDTGTWFGPISWSRATKPDTDLSPIVTKKPLSETDGSWRTFLIHNDSGG